MLDFPFFMCYALGLDLCFVIHIKALYHMSQPSSQARFPPGATTFFNFFPSFFNFVALLSGSGGEAYVKGQYAWIG